MSTGMPNFITPAGPLYANALAAAERARDERTGTPAVVLRAPAAAAACLERARSALLALREIDPPLPGLPSVVPNAPHDDGDGEVTLILGELRGAPLRDYVLGQGALAEAALLALAREQAQLLAALHQLGYSGLRPTSGEAWVWWDGEAPRATFLGWEWLVAGTDDAPGDVRAAAGLWIELAAGLPPWPDLAVAVGPPAWLALSLGLRVLLTETWLAAAPPPAGRLKSELAELQRRAAAPSAELLARGRELLASDPAGALAWLDLARRAAPPAAGADAVYQAAAAALDGQAANWIEQGRRDLGLGQYESAERNFARGQVAWHANATLRLSAARWRLAATALRQAVQADLSAKGLPVRDLERGLLDVVAQANAGLLDDARAGLEALWGRVPTGVNLSALDALQADLRACQQWSRGRAAQAAGQTDEALALLAGALAEKPHVSHWEVLTGTLGDPAGAYLALRRQAQRQAEADALAADAIQRLAAGDASAAAQLAARAAGLSRDWPDLLAERNALSARARLRASAIEAGVAGDAANLSWGERNRALSALQVVHAAFPGDEWTASHATRWRQALLELLERAPGSPAGRWLWALWSADEVVVAALRRAAPQGLKRWTRAVQAAEAALASGRPAGLTDAAQQLADASASISVAHEWLTAAGQDTAGQELRQRTEGLISQISNRRAQQAALRAAYEAAWAQGQPVSGVLGQAAEAGVELYDAIEQSLEHLAEQAAYPSPRFSSPWSQAFVLAHNAWEAKDDDKARTAFRIVKEDVDASESARQYAELAIQCIDCGLPLPKPDMLNFNVRAGVGLSAKHIVRPQRQLKLRQKHVPQVESRQRTLGWFRRVGLVILILVALSLFLFLGLPFVQEAILATRETPAAISSPTPHQTMPGRPDETPTVHPPGVDDQPEALVGRIVIEPDFVELPADGQAICIFSITAYDIQGDPAGRRRVNLSVSPLGHSERIAQEAELDESGKFSYVFRADTQPGKRQLEVTIDDVVAFGSIVLVSATPDSDSD